MSQTAPVGEKSAPGYDAGSPHSYTEHPKGRDLGSDPEDASVQHTVQNALKRDLKGRHMQMIAMLVLTTCRKIHLSRC
jgi:amino acid permease